MKHCGKHDITYPDSGSCWNCEESAMTPEQKETAYSDPEFLAKRGGSSAHQSTAISQTVIALSALKPDELKNLIALAQGKASASPTSAGTRAIA